MKQTSGPAKQPADTVVKDIRRATCRQSSAPLRLDQPEQIRGSKAVRFRRLCFEETKGENTMNSKN